MGWLTTVLGIWLGSCGGRGAPDAAGQDAVAKDQFTVKPPAKRLATPCPSKPGGFTDCMATSGIATGASGGIKSDEMMSTVLVADIDEDGLPDVFYWGINTIGIYHNRGQFQFEDVWSTSGLGPALATKTNGMVRVSAGAFGDLDHDGHVDLVLCLGAYDALLTRSNRAPAVPTNRLGVYRNNGNGVFGDVTAAWGFGPAPLADGVPAFGTGFSLVDINGDGRLDVVESRTHFKAHTLVFLSQADGTWKEVGAQLFPGAGGFTHATGFHDWNHDGWLDFFVLNDNGPAVTQPGEPSGNSHLYLRDKLDPPHFTETIVPALFAATAPPTPMGMGTGDFDGDGLVDLLLSDGGGSGRECVMVISKGVNVAAQLGIAYTNKELQPYLEQACWTPASLDIDNDGQLDLFATVAPMSQYLIAIQPSVLFRRDGPVFRDASALLREQGPQREYGVAIADFDGDGRADIFAGAYKHEPRFLRNEVAGGHSVTIRLRGKTANTEGIGAIVTVEVAGIVPQTVEIFGGGGKSGYGPTTRTMGIGSADKADKITVNWKPAGGTAVQVVTQVPAGPVLIEEP